MKFIMVHLDDVFIAITSVVTAASAICALTPTPKDDSFVAKIRSFLDILALNVGKVKTADTQ